MIKLLTIGGTTLEATEGNHGALDIKLRRGASVAVKCDNKPYGIVAAQPDYDTWSRVEFNFCKHGVVVPYKIEIFSEKADSILEIVDVLWDTMVETVTVHNCSSLLSMRFHNVGSFDFSGCPNIKHLDCDYYKGEVLDLTALTHLNSLRCQSGEAATIELSKSPCVISLDLCGCKMKTLKVSNQISLLSLCIESCDNLKTQTKTWLEKNVTDNDGSIKGSY